ncbi:MAG: molybdenum cofactor biosynthesis protein MoaE [Candidatus Zixiibacteriota bacterium]
MSEDPFIAIRPGPFTVEEIEKTVRAAGNGAVCTFSGWVRNVSRERTVVALEYDAYVPMAENLMETIAREIMREYDINGLAMVHRIGRMTVGELVVVVSAGAPHRDAAFRAAREGIDRLKKTVPIWKKEFFVDGSEWAGATPDE